MMDKGMPVDALNNHGNTALMRAAYRNRTDVVHFLLQKCAAVDKRSNPGGFTALHFASLSNNTDIIRILLQHGASTDIKGKDGETPIEWARMVNNKEAVRLLQQC